MKYRIHKRGIGVYNEYNKSCKFKKIEMHKVYGILNCNFKGFYRSV